MYLENGLRGLPFSPTLEPATEDAVYVNDSDEALSEGNFNRVPILLGFNSQEAVVASEVPCKSLNTSIELILKKLYFSLPGLLFKQLRHFCFHANSLDSNSKGSQ